VAAGRSRGGGWHRECRCISGSARAKAALAAMERDTVRVEALCAALKRSSGDPGNDVFSDDVVRLPNTVLSRAGLKAETASSV